MLETIIAIELAFVDFFIMLPIKNKCLNCNKLFIDNSKNKVKKYCSKYCGGSF